MDIMEEKKFIETYDVEDWEVFTDTGWEDITKIHKTIPYTIWHIETESYELDCADNHIVFNDSMEEVFVKDLKIGDKIVTENGLEEIKSITETIDEDNMYDLELTNNSLHRYYTNGILSHNTTTSAIYLLWFAMKYPYKDILITSYTETSANEILAMIRLLYENCPDFIKVPIKVANVQSLIFSNNSRIFSRATTLKAARGLSPAYIYCDEFAFVGNGESAQKSLEKQEEFYASISPALSASKGKLAITSTPISESDLFYRMWSGAIRKTDDNGLDFPKDYIISVDGELYRDFHLFKDKTEAETYINTLDKDHKYEIVEKDPMGNNGFTSQLVKWDKSPFKDQKWAELERKKIGDEKFEREFNCLSGDSIVTIKDNSGNVFDISLKMLYNYQL